MQSEVLLRSYLALQCEDDVKVLIANITRHPSDQFILAKPKSRLEAALVKSVFTVQTGKR